MLAEAVVFIGTVSLWRHNDTAVLFVTHRTWKVQLAVVGKLDFDNWLRAIYQVHYRLGEISIFPSFILSKQNHRVSTTFAQFLERTHLADNGIGSRIVITAKKRADSAPYQSSAENSNFWPEH